MKTVEELKQDYLDARAAADATRARGNYGYEAYDVAANTAWDLLQARLKENQDD